MLEVENGTRHLVPVALSLRIRTKVHLGELRPSDVAVELYVGRVDMNGELIEGWPVPMSAEGNPMDGVQAYTLDTSIVRSGLHGVYPACAPLSP